MTTPSLPLVRRTGLVVLTTAALVVGGAAGPGPADAAGGQATLRLDGGTLVYTASAGAANWPFVSSLGGGGTLRIEDSGDRIAPGAGCVRPDPADETTVVCPTPAGLRLELGDGADRDTLAAGMPPIPLTVLGGAGNDVLSGNEEADSRVLLDGGDGNDVLEGTRYADTLTGGAGNDMLRGYGGDDRLRGGDGNDLLEPDTFPDVIGNDLVDGGPGFDAVKDWYSTSTDPRFAITVTLDGVANDGRPPAEADNVVAVERFEPVAPGRYVLGASDDSIDLPGFGTSVVEGRGGRDTITGNGGAERIDGGPGDDRLEGGYGNDTIVGGPGRDVIFGDETSPCPSASGCTPFGNDTIWARDGEADVIDCGVGTDRAVVDAIDRVAHCEVVDRRGGPACTVPKGLRGRTLSVARQRLRAAHCTRIAVRKAKSRSVRKGRVIRAVRKGEVVVVIVSRGRR